jgi:hypothetical protein
MTNAVDPRGLEPVDRGHLLLARDLSSSEVRRDS